MYRGCRVAVVMPIHNEQEHLVRAISRVPPFVDTIVAIDDGSTDDTWERLSQIDNGKLVRLRHETNRGVGAATKTGYRYLLEGPGDLIAVMDGDGQMDGRDLGPLLDCAIAGADYVRGNRFLHRETIPRMPAGRYIGNLIFSWLTRRAAMLEIDLDAQCGYSVIRRSALRLLDLDRMYDRYGFPNEMVLAASRTGLAVESVPVRCVYGDEVSGINPFTSVPVITCLIARSYLRRKLSFNPVTLSLRLGDIER
ncbi:MAG: glycosyltransferase family 2 protein [Blastocatellia bacterium]|nr:glycosyltransferase family 2 protein [Blastocatellia bacterium]